MKPNFSMYKNILKYELNIKRIENIINDKVKPLIILLLFIKSVLYSKNNIIEKFIIVTNNSWKNPSLA